MSDKNRRPVIRKLINPGLRSGFPEAGTSPTTPLEFKVLSPTGIINRDMGGIGLGIVAALEDSPAKKVNFSCRNRMWSDPIQVNRSRTVGDRAKRDKPGSFVRENTIVTSNKSITKVYHGVQANEIKGKGCIFNISPARFGDYDMKGSQPAGFLSSCHLCNKRLHGKDIYMYRGEKSFCSPECRSRQIAMDERPEKYCSSQASSSGTSRVIAAGIFAI